MANGNSGIGNAWHLPRNSEPPGQASMRSPLTEIDAGTEVVLINGNQYQGAGVTGNQTQSGSAVRFRQAGSAAWSTRPMRFLSAVGNNKYFAATIPPNTFDDGAAVEYYFRIDYTDRPTTFVHGNDARSSTTANEAEAQASPFAFSMRHDSAAAGESIPLDSGPLKARVFKDTGHLELAGPDLDGNPHFNVITFMPPAVELAGGTLTIGRVLASNLTPAGLELTQQLGAGSVKARLSFPLEGVMRYEVIEWGGASPNKVSVSAASSATEHFYGLGEKFNALEQSGNVVQMLTCDNPGDKGDRSYKTAPWFISTRDYGFHLDSTARSRFDMRASDDNRYTVTNLVGNLTFNVVYGPGLTDVLSRYTGYTGRPPLPPPFAFGPWISSDIWRDGGEVNYAVTMFRKRGIPVSAFVFDSPWEVAYNDFKFNIGDPNRTQFGHPGTFENKAFTGFTKFSDMMTFFRTNGLKVICWMTPFVNVSSVDEHVRGQNLGEAKPDHKDSSFFVRKSKSDSSPLVVTWWKGRGSPIDFTKKEARDWLTDRLKDLIDASKVDTRNGQEPAIGGFKTDDGE